MDINLIAIPAIELHWTDWYVWERLTLDARIDPNSVTPPNVSGVYEVRLNHQDERLTIGKAANLRRRVKQGLVKGKMPHSSGKDIRAHEDTTQIVIRWAETDRPAAVEEELHRRHKEIFGRLPKYTDRT
ncbi:MAG TPA: hypothetical protein PKH77_28280 [Anaerolineae bacterium]|nr:hypothetical protein [Anaerolineae bacterium]